MQALSSESLRFSAWVHTFNHGETVACFHALNFGLAFFNKVACGADGLPLIEGIDQEKRMALVQEGLLVPLEHDDKEDLLRLREKLSKRRYLDMLYLLLHDGCNLRCAYCFEDVAPSPMHRPSAMSDEVIEQSLSLFGRLSAMYGHPSEPRMVHLYGGEPLLNPHGVSHAINQTRKFMDSGALPRNTLLTIVTNGTLMTPELADTFAENQVSVGLSIDGPEDLTNRHRLSRHRRINVYERVVAAYRALRERGVKVGLSVTLTPELVRDFDAGLKFFVEDLGIQDGICFNILHRHPRFQTSSAYAEEAAGCMVKAFELFTKLGIYEERMMRRAQAFIQRRPTYADCGVPGNQIVVAPDGVVGLCQDFVKPRQYFSGSVFDTDFDPYKTGLFGDWLKRSPLFMEACESCPAIGICGGGCPANAEIVTGNKWNIDSRVCPYSLQSLEWLIWSTHARL